MSVSTTVWRPIDVFAAARPAALVQEGPRTTITRGGDRLSHLEQARERVTEAAELVRGQRFHIMGGAEAPTTHTVALETARDGHRLLGLALEGPVTRPLGSAIRQAQTELERGMGLLTSADSLIEHRNTISMSFDSAANWVNVAVNHVHGR